MKIIIKSPLRISFFGGGTDFASYFNLDYGRVISCTIDKYITVNYNSELYGDHLVDLFLKNYNIPLQQLKIDSDITNKGSGLGTSASMTLSLLLINKILHGEPCFNKSILAKEAYEFGINILNAPIGKQDEYSIAYGGFNDIIFLKNETKVFDLTHIYDKLKIFEKHLLLYNLNMPRNSRTVLEKQQQNIPNKIDILDQMKNMVTKSLKLFEAEKYNDIGALLDESWKLKKQLTNNISNDKIDEIYNEAIKYGANGGKVLGAGNGGHILLNAPDELIKNRIIYQFNKKYPELKLTPFKFVKNGIEIVEYIK